MVEIVERPGFTSSDFSGSNKKPGLTAIVRLRNEEEFGKRSLASVLPFFDEIVIVFNDSQDRTAEIVEEFARAHPGKVRAFYYVPKVFPRGSRGHRTTDVRSVHSLIHYYNFALSLASYQIRCKWDGDQIAEPAAFGRVVQELRALRPGTLRWWLSPWRLGYWWYTGVNLWDYEGQTLVTKDRPLLGKKRDHGFWPAGRLIRYKATPYCEYLFTRMLRPSYVGCLFFHLRGMKADRGHQNFYFEENPESLYRGGARQELRRDELITLDELLASRPEVGELGLPETLGIHPRRRVAESAAQPRV
jgi:glycosyltransferase involved in cell wall biosynthesis